MVETFGEIFGRMVVSSAGQKSVGEKNKNVIFLPHTFLSDLSYISSRLRVPEGASYRYRER
jgi:hypothetical protein